MVEGTHSFSYTIEHAEMLWAQDAVYLLIEYPIAV
jgi:hypothetical protein